MALKWIQRSLLLRFKNKLLVFLNFNTTYTNFVWFLVIVETVTETVKLECDKFVTYDNDNYYWYVDILMYWYIIDNDNWYIVDILMYWYIIGNDTNKQQTNWQQTTNKLTTKTQTNKQ